MIQKINVLLICIFALLFAVASCNSGDSKDDKDAATAGPTDDDDSDDDDTDDDDTDDDDTDDDDTDDDDTDDDDDNTDDDDTVGKMLRVKGFTVLSGQEIKGERFIMQSIGFTPPSSGKGTIVNK